MVLCCLFIFSTFFCPKVFLSPSFLSIVFFWRRGCEINWKKSNGFDCNSYQFLTEFIQYFIYCMKIGSYCSSVANRKLLISKLNCICIHILSWSVYVLLPIHFPIISILEMVSRVELEHQKLDTQVQFSAFFNKELHNWIMIYPLYLNSKKSISKGRLIPLSCCVDNPTSKEIAKVLLTSGFHIMLEDKKVHPLEPSRDCLHLGRVRVQFWKEGQHNRELIYPEYSNKRSFLIFIAEQVSKLENRQKMFNQPQTISKYTENDTKYTHSRLKKSKKRC